MKRFILGFFLAAVLLVGYWAWPFVGLHALAADMQARDTAALNEQVDFVRLRRSLTDQIIAAYMRLDGRAAKLGPFGNIGVVVGASIADPIVAQIINAENLVELFNGGTVSTDFGKVSFGTGPLPTGSFDAAWRAWRGTDYWLDRFSIGLPAAAAPEQQFRLRMKLSQWQWKLTGIDLPQSLRDRFAKALAQSIP